MLAETCLHATMRTEDKFVSAALDAIKQDDAKRLLAAAFDALGQLSPELVTLAQQAFAAGFGLGRAGDFPPQAQNFLALMAGQSVAPEAFQTMRKALEISQADFGKLCGVTSQTVSLWETGVYPIPASAIRTMVMLITQKTPSLEKTISGAELRKLRKALRMYVKDFAAALGVSISAVEKWERLATQPVRPAMMARIKPQLDALQARAATVAQAKADALQVRRAAAA
jgi:DNA-binding transcriptional regulator YiaG